MKKFNIILATLLCSCFSTMLAADNGASPITNYKFGGDSPLADGRWVKFSITGSGVYEISYDQLREMGFSNPESVAIYGTGGHRRSLNFTDANGNPLMTDNVEAVPLIHRNNKVIFYGVGDRNVNFKIYSTGGSSYPYFQRRDLNTWSENSYYLLTDSKPAAAPEQLTAGNKSGAKLNVRAYGRLFHEEEYQNGFEGYYGGDSWWGPYLLNNNQKNSFNVMAKYYDTETQDRLPRVDIYSDITIFRGPSGTFTIDCNGSKKTHDFNKGSSQIFTYDSHLTSNKLTPTTAYSSHAGVGEIAFSYGGEYGSSYIMAIDYWSAAYTASLKYIDSDWTFDQFEAGFMNNSFTTTWKHYLPKNSVVWDITVPTKPTAPDTDSQYFYSDNRSSSQIVVFNPNKQMRRINSDWREIRNTNLHALQNEEAYDMVIITVERLKSYADRIAELHRELDGQRVAVATQEDIFNEFNGGTPDPTAYRLLAKMLYHHPDHKLKNVLLLGPLRSDYRNLRGYDNQGEALIAYMDFYDQDIWSESMLALDHTGIITDYNNATSIMNMPVTLGVGILPIDGEQDAELAVAKIRSHLEKKDFSGIVNESYTMSCAGDSHIHEKQAIAMGELFQSHAARLDSKFAHETLWSEYYGRDLTAARAMEAMRRGKAFIGYFGHADLNTLQCGFNIYHSMNAGNEDMGLGFWGACDLSVPDKGEHGIGDLGVLRSKNGFVGILASTRRVMSNHNETLGINFVNSMFIDRNGNPRTITPTTGEVHANAKDRTNNNSALCYVYVGDPGLRVPMALTKVNLSVPEEELHPGQIVTIKGNVLDTKGNPYDSYNGYVTLKLMEPPRWIITQADGTDQKMPDYEINDLPILTLKGEVRNGKFSVKIPLPEDVDQYVSDDEENVKLPLLAGTWDGHPDVLLGGSGICELKIALSSSEAPGEDLVKDTSAPQIVFGYDKDLCLLTVTGSDNVAMLPGVGQGAGINLTINGQEALVESTELAGTSVQSYKASVDVNRLGYGKHTATAVATDMAGNVSEPKTFSFQIEAPASKPTLSIDSAIVTDELSFKIADTNKTMQLVIADTDGNVVRDSETEPGLNTIDLSELPSGEYQAYARINSAQGTKIYSNTVKFTVID